MEEFSIKITDGCNDDILKLAQYISNIFFDDDLANKTALMIYSHIRTLSIEVGKSADMVVLDKNLYEIPVETIHETKLLITVFRGKEVYKA